MKAISDLRAALNKESFYIEQFDYEKSKRILFVNPQLSSRNLYQMLIPYYELLSHSDFCSAITNGIRTYNEKDIDLEIGEEEIKWATHIVFPFTTKNIIPVFTRIKEINDEAIVCYWLDYDFYNIPESHPMYKETIDNLENIESNCFYTDKIFVDNVFLQKSIQANLGKRFMEVYEQRGYEVYSQISVIPFMFNTDILLSNIDFEPQKSIRLKLAETIAAEAPKKIDNKDHDKKPKAGKKANVESKKEDKKSLSPSTKTKKTTSVAKKANVKVAPKNAKNIQKGKNAPSKPSGKKQSVKTEAKPSKRKNSAQTATKKPNQDSQLPEVKDEFSFSNSEVKRFALIYSESKNEEFLKHMSDVAKIKKEFGDKVEFIIFGIRPDKANAIMNQFETEFEFIEPVSIIHWFKQIHSEIENKGIDAFLLLMDQNAFNVSTEGTGKIIEASIFATPVIAPAMGIYRMLLVNGQTSVLFNQKGGETVYSTLTNILHKTSKKQLEMMGKSLSERIQNLFSTTKENVTFVAELYD